VPKFLAPKISPMLRRYPRYNEETSQAWEGKERRLEVIDKGGACVEEPI